MRKRVKLFQTIILVLAIGTAYFQYSVCADEKEVERIVEEYEGPEGILKIDAEKMLQPDEIYTGEVVFLDVSFSDGKKLYGDFEKWRPSDLWKDGEALEYGNSNIYLMSIPEEHVFYFENMNDAKEIAESEQISENEAYTMAQEAISVLKLHAGVIGEYKTESEPEGIYTYILGGEIQGLPVAALSDIYSNGSVEISGNQYTYISYSRHYIPENQIKTEILDFSQILEKVQTYIESGYITLPKEDSFISKISLVYYVENTADGMRFYPVWNFQIPPVADHAFMLGRDTDDLFYIDANSGMLVKTMY